MRRRFDVLAASMLLALAVISCGSAEPSVGDVATTIGTTTTVGATTTAVSTTTPTSGTAVLTPTTVAVSNAAGPPPPPPSTAPPAATIATTTTTPLGPQLVSFSVTAPPSCIAPDPTATSTTVSSEPTWVVLVWSFTDATEVYVAIDNENVPHRRGLPASGELRIDYPCPGPHTFFAVATRGDLRVVASKTSP